MQPAVRAVTGALGEGFGYPRPAQAMLAQRGGSGTGAAHRGRGAHRHDRSLPEPGRDGVSVLTMRPGSSGLFERRAEFLGYLAVVILGERMAHAENERDRPLDDLGGR